jgi:hypothetical protein
LSIEIDLNLPALRVVRVHDRVAAILSCYCTGGMRRATCSKT